MKRSSRWRFLDKLRRKIFLKYELKRLILKSIILNTRLPRTHRFYALYNKSKLYRISSVTQHKNKCIRTGRVWSVVKTTRYSRFVFRSESNYGNLPTFRRASW